MVKGTGTGAPEVALVQDRNLIRIVPSEPPDQGLRVRMVPRAPGRREPWFAVHARDAPRNPCVRNRVTVSEARRRGGRPGTGLDEGLGCPRGGRLRGAGDIEDEVPRRCAHGYREADHDAACRHGEELAGHERRPPGVPEGSLRRRRWWAAAHPICLNRGLCPGRSALPQRAQDARGAP